MPRGIKKVKASFLETGFQPDSKPKEIEVYDSMKGINWRTKLKIVSEVIDNYERAHGLGKYTPVQTDFTKSLGKPSYPTLEGTNSHAEAIEGELTAGLYMTSKEGVRQDFELALHHIRIARRYFRKAFTV